MSFAFILFLIAAVVAGIGAAIAALAPEDATRSGGRFVAAGGGLLALVLMFLSSLTMVPANEVGIVTNFGAWSGTRTSGVSFTAPWSSVDTFGTRNQKSVRDEAEGNGTCVGVKMDGGSTGCQDLTVLYTVDQANAQKLWEGWKDFSRLNADLIERQTDDAVLSVYSSYKPLDAQGAKRNEVSDKVTTELRKRLEPQGVSLESITLGTLHLPQETQDNLNKLTNADTNLSIALKGEEQAKAENRTNAARQSALTPEALVMECLRTAREVRPQIMPSCGLGAQGDTSALVNIK